MANKRFQGNVFAFYSQGSQQEQPLHVIVTSASLLNEQHAFRFDQLDKPKKVGP